MKEAQFVESDGEYVIFETKDGKFRAALDEALRAAIRKAPSSPADQPISPRDIQERVRAGATVAELVKATKADTAYVESFARAVFEELDHIVATARTVRI